MYQSSYAEVLADSTANARHEERRALDHAVKLLRRAKTSAPKSPEEIEAIGFVMQLWAIFVTSLASPENDLPESLRVSLMSIGIGVMSEAARIESGESRDFDAVAEICSIVREGLA